MIEKVQEYPRFWRFRRLQAHAMALAVRNGWIGLSLEDKGRRTGCEVVDLLGRRSILTWIDSRSIAGEVLFSVAWGVDGTLRGYSHENLFLLKTPLIQARAKTWFERKTGPYLAGTPKNVVGQASYYMSRQASLFFDKVPLPSVPFGLTGPLIL